MYDTTTNTFMGELDNLLGPVLKSLVHSIILREQTLFQEKRIGTGMILRL